MFLYLINTFAAVKPNIYYSGVLQRRRGARKEEFFSSSTGDHKVALFAHF